MGMEAAFVVAGLLVAVEGEWVPDVVEAENAPDPLLGFIAGPCAREIGHQEEDPEAGGDGPGELVDRC